MQNVPCVKNNSSSFFPSENTTKLHVCKMVIKNTYLSLIIRYLWYVIHKMSHLFPMDIKHYWHSHKAYQLGALFQGLTLFSAQFTVLSLSEYCTETYFILQECFSWFGILNVIIKMWRKGAQNENIYLK